MGSHIKKHLLRNKVEMLSFIQNVSGCRLTEVIIKQSRVILIHKFDLNLGFSLTYFNSSQQEQACLFSNCSTLALTFWNQVLFTLQGHKFKRIFLQGEGIIRQNLKWFMSLLNDFSSWLKILRWGFSGLRF